MDVYIILSIICYFLGSIPTSYILGRKLYNIDILNSGSYHSGLSNIYKYASRKIVLIILSTDVLLKGFVPVYIIYNFYNSYILSAIFLIFGHNWSLFLRFKGGKGLSVSIGILAALNIKIFLLLLFLFFLFWVIEKFKDSSKPWILSFLFTVFILIIDFFYLNKIFDNLSIMSVYLTIFVFLLLLFRRTLGNESYNNFNRKILLNRLMFDRDIK